MSTPTPPVAPNQADPSLRGVTAGLTTVLAAVLVGLGAHYGLDLDTATATLIAGALAGILGPIVTALVARARAWHPNSVATLQADLMALVHEAQQENPPAIVTGPVMGSVEAHETHPGVLGFSGPGEHSDLDDDKRGRHERS